MKEHDYTAIEASDKLVTVSTPSRINLRKDVADIGTQKTWVSPDFLAVKFIFKSEIVSVFRRTGMVAAGFPSLEGELDISVISHIRYSALLKSCNLNSIHAVCKKLN